METYTTEMKIPGGTLCVRTGELETACVSVFFIPEGTETEIDIAFIESYYNDDFGKVGDINTYVYAVPDKEDWTYKHTVTVDELTKVAKCIEKIFDDGKEN